MIKKTSAAAIFLALSAGTMTAKAAPLALKGSDTLEPMTSDLLANKCPAAMLNAALSYIGGGSGGGENAMGANGPGGLGQLVAPMSGVMNATGGNCAMGNASSTAQGMVVGLDGLSLVADASSTEFCGGGHPHRPDEPTSAPTGTGSRFKATDAFSFGSYTPTDWKDVLKLLYVGISNATTTANCNSTARQALAAHYENLFQGGCTANANCANGIKHAYRRNDISGTTDTFLKLIGAPSRVQDSAGNVTSIAYCNGLDYDDNDPIRRPCDPQEQVCEYDGTLGLVLSISVPTNTNDTTVLYNGGSLPTFGRFLTAQALPCAGPATWIVPGVVPATAALQNAVGNNASRCDCRFPHPNDFLHAAVDENGVPLANPALAAKNPRFNWNVRVGNKCQVPSTTTSASTTRWGLLNGDDGSRDNSPPGWGNRIDDGTGFLKCCGVTINGATNTPVTEDPRALNLFTRDPANGNFLTLVGNGVANTGDPAPSFYRIHTSTNGKTNVAVSAGTSICQKVDATEGIGCLVEFPTDECSVGFAGLEASDKIFAERMAINDVDATLTTIPVYPLSRKLYLNSLFGFGNMGENATTHTGSLTSYAPGTAGTAAVNAQYNLAKCFYSDYNDALPSLTKVGFIPLPASGGKPFCEDQCGGTNACVSGDATVLGSFDNIFSR